MSQTPEAGGVRATTRKIARLALPYFRSDQKWKARGLLGAIIGLNLLNVYLLVLYNDWYGVFYAALESRNQPVFWEQLFRFTWIAFALIITAVYKFYLTQLLEVRWRNWMTGHYQARWLASQAFYRMELARFSGALGRAPDNPDQRIQEDLNLFTTYTVSLTMGAFNALVTLVTFVGILWGLSGAFSFDIGGSTWVIPGFMVWAAVLYCAVGSLVTHLIGRPQIPLNYQQQRLEADYRHHLMRVREYSEAIALDRGEAVERGQLDLRFSRVLANYLELLRKQKNLVWFTSFFGQAAVVFPFIVAAPRLFSGAINLGGLMQIATAFGRVQDSLSWFVDNYSSLAAWRATTDRLTDFEDQLVAQSVPLQAEQVGSEAGLRATGLTLGLPNGAVLLADAALQVRPGESVVVRGPSGGGKSTLLRAFAGIWPFAQGRVERPADAMFIPQHPYFPEGRLRDALAYPEPADRYGDDALRQALNDALLPDLASRLDDEDAWSQKLSGGERQRLAIARVLLKQPAWLFADEATSALDEEAEHTLYGRLKALVAGQGGAMVSVAHRSAVAAFHDREWRLAPQPPGAPARFGVSER